VKKKRLLDRAYLPSGELRLTDLMKSSGFRKYLANTSWMMGEKSIRLGINLIIGIIIARYLGPRDYGLLAYAISFVSIFGVMSSLGFQDVLIRELIKEGDKREELLGTTFLLRLAGACLLLLTVAIISLMVFPDKSSITMVMIVASSHIFLSFNVIESFFESKVKARISSRSLLIALLGSSVFKIILVMISATVVCFAFSMLVESMILSICLVAFYHADGNSVLDWKFLRGRAISLLSDSWPLAVAWLFAMAYTRVDQIMIKYLLGNQELGYYAVAVSMTEAWTVLPAVITASFFPAIIYAKRRGESLYKFRMQRLFTLLVWISIFISVPISLFSKPIIFYLFGDSYSNSSEVLAVLIWSSVPIFIGIVNGKWIVAENLQRIWLIINPIGMFLNVALNLIFIPKYGNIGAAYTTVLTQIVIAHIVFIFWNRTIDLYRFHHASLVAPFFFLKKQLLFKD